MKIARALMCVATLAMAAVAPVRAAVVVVRPVDAVHENERRFGAVLAGHVERWYREAGVACTVADDTNLDAALAGKRVATLVYCASPTAQQMASLRAFVARGGKLIVSYSSSPALAKLMQVRLDGYRKGTTDGRWSSMRFGTNAPRGVPSTVVQTSANLFLVQPVPGVSSVLAWWHDRAGQKTEEPAWLMSPVGFWMTHVLTADGDEEAKRQLLLALAASVDESLWVPAARATANAARAVGGLGSVAALARRGASLHDAAAAARVQDAVVSLQRCEARVTKALAEGRGYDAWRAAQEMKSRMYEGYGMLQPTRTGEIRAVWDHSGMGLYPGNWPRTCRLLKDAGITDVFVNVAGAAFAHYASTVLPRSVVFAEQGDQLAACVAACHAVGLRVHAWILCFSTERATAERLSIFAARGWRLTLADGTLSPFLDPSHPAVKTYVVNAVEEMATRYAVDGVHLDFIRWRDFASSLGDATRKRFLTETKRTDANAWPSCVQRDGAIRTAFLAWRSQQVTDVVQQARRVMRAKTPKKWLTVAVYGKYPSCVTAVGQDWESWLNIHLVDYVLPMNYEEDLGRFTALVADQTRTRAQALRVIPGIGVTASESRLDAAAVVDQIRIVRAANCPGFALFDLDMTLRQEIFPVLSLGALRRVREQPKR